MSRVRTEEEKLLLNPYISLSTIQRYFSLSKTDTVDIFVKVQETDEEKGFLNLYEDKVRSEGVFELFESIINTIFNAIVSALVKHMDYKRKLSSWHLIQRLLKEN